MTLEELKSLESSLEVHGFKKWTCSLSSHETYGYFKSFDYIKDEYDEERPSYQIEYRIWDFAQYGAKGSDAYGIDIIVLESCEQRCDMVLTVPDFFDIDRVEALARDFNVFCHKHNIGKWDDPVS